MSSRVACLLDIEKKERKKGEEIVQDIKRFFNFFFFYKVS